MKHNINIPGWNGQEILNKLGEYASEVPENGCILELGALFGRSTYTLGFNKKNSVKLITIDLWPTIELKNHTIIPFHDGRCGKEEISLLNSKIRPDPMRLEGDDFYALWKKFTEGIINNESIRSDTFIENKDFPLMDIIYHDAAHNFFEVYRDLNHWFPKLKSDGIFIIDDYEVVHFPGVVAAVDLFVKLNNLNTEMITHRNILLRRK